MSWHNTVSGVLWIDNNVIWEAVSKKKGDFYVTYLDIFEKQFSTGPLMPVEC